jgi:hypothetical protein
MEFRDDELRHFEEYGAIPLPVPDARGAYLRHDRDRSTEVATSGMGPLQTHAPQQLPALFDHLVGAQHEQFRYREAERLGGFENHDWLEFAWAFDRAFAWARTSGEFC